jgi:hypothetical protein
VGSSCPRIRVGQSSRRKEISRLSEGNRKTIANQGDGLFCSENFPGLHISCPPDGESKPEGEAAARLLQLATAAHRVSPWEILLEQFKNVLILILLGATVISLFLGHGVESIVIAVIVLFAVFSASCRSIAPSAPSKRCADGRAHGHRAARRQRSETPARDLVAPAMW